MPNLDTNYTINPYEFVDYMPKWFGNPNATHITSNSFILTFTLDKEGFVYTIVVKHEKIKVPIERQYEGTNNSDPGTYIDWVEQEVEIQ